MPISRTLDSWASVPEPGLLPSTGFHRLLRYCEPLRFPSPPVPFERLDVASAHDDGPPVLRGHPSRRAVSTTPADSPITPRFRRLDSAAFPVNRAGRRPRQSFGACSEFTRVTARRVAARLSRTSFRRPSNPSVTWRVRSVATEVYRKLLGQDLHLLDDDAFTAPIFS